MVGDGDSLGNPRGLVAGRPRGQALVKHRGGINDVRGGGIIHWDVSWCLRPFASPNSGSSAILLRMARDSRFGVREVAYPTLGNLLCPLSSHALCMCKRLPSMPCPSRLSTNMFRPHPPSLLVSASSLYLPPSFPLPPLACLSSSSHPSSSPFPPPPLPSSWRPWLGPTPRARTLRRRPSGCLTTCLGRTRRSTAAAPSSATCWRRRDGPRRAPRTR